MRWVTLSAVILAAIATANAQGILTNFLNTFENRDSSEGAPYQVVKSTGQYEERYYPARKWVCTEQQGRDGEDISSGMFMKLFRYISGGNARDESISMTIPVSTQVSRDASTRMVTHRMCFFIGQIHQANPPQPNNAEVFIENREPITIFTRQVPGYMDADDWTNEFAALSGILTSAGESFTTEPFWRAGYDSPMKFWDRRNEVWVSKN